MTRPLLTNGPRSCKMLIKGKYMRGKVTSRGEHSGLSAQFFWKLETALKNKIEVYISIHTYIFKGGHRADRHSPSWNAVCRKESSKRRQRPSAQHWGSPPTTSSQPLGVFRPGGEERGEDEGGQDQDAGSQEGSLWRGGTQLPKPRFPPHSPLGSPSGRGEERAVC